MKKVNGVYKEDPIHSHFGLTYAHWLVLPRVGLQSMPYEWQQKMVKLLEEMQESIDWLPDGVSPYVSFRDTRGKFAPMIDLPHYRHSYLPLKEQGKA